MDSKKRRFLQQRILDSYRKKDAENKSGHVMYIFVKNIQTHQTMGKKGKPYDAVLLEYISLNDNGYRRLDKTPSFRENGQNLLKNLKKGKCYRVIVDKRNGEDYYNWYDISEFPRDLAKQLAGLVGGGYNE
jgi:hypothetical protein